MDQCQTLDKLGNKGRSDVFYRKVRQLTRQSMMRKSSKATKDMNGRLLTDKSNIKQRWREYIETLYDAERNPGKYSLDLEREDEVDKDSKRTGSVIQTYIYIYVCMYVCMHIYLYILTHFYNRCVHRYICACVCARARECEYVYMWRVCVSVYVSACGL